LRFWIPCIALLVAAWWSRPSGPEREALGRYRVGARALVFVPLSSAWLKVVHPDDFVPLGDIRRRFLISLTALAVIVALGTWLPAESYKRMGEGLPTSDAPVAKTAPILKESEPSRGVPRKRTAEPSQQPVSEETEPAPARSRRVLGEESVASLRTPIRLYGTAKVSAVYDVYEFLGVRLENIEPKSFWDILGVQEGDVVVEVHGEYLDNPAIGVALINSLSGDPEVRIRVRDVNGSERYLEYTAPE
jgi:hypothetical protein